MTIRAFLLGFYAIVLFSVTSAFAQEERRLIVQPGPQVITEDDWPIIRAVLVERDPFLPRYIRELGYEFTVDWVSALWFDFDNDGTNEISIVVEHAAYCGTAGCSLFILKRSSTGFELTQTSFADLIVGGFEFYIRREVDGKWVLTSGP